MRKEIEDHRKGKYGKKLAKNDEFTERENMGGNEDRNMRLQERGK